MIRSRQHVRIMYKLKYTGMPLNSTRQRQSLVIQASQHLCFTCNKAGLTAGAAFAGLVSTTDEQWRAFSFSFLLSFDFRALSQYGSNAGLYHPHCSCSIICTAEGNSAFSSCCLLCKSSLYEFIFPLPLKDSLCSSRSLSSTVSLHQAPVMNTVIYTRSVMIDITIGKDKGIEPTVSGEDVCPKDLVVAIKIETFKRENVSQSFSPRGRKLWHKNTDAKWENKFPRRGKWDLEMHFNVNERFPYKHLEPGLRSGAWRRHIDFHGRAPGQMRLAAPCSLSFGSKQNWKHIL